MAEKMTEEEREQMIQNIISKLILLGIVEPKQDDNQREEIGRSQSAAHAGGANV
ncbi:MAG: hypothetical protein J5582_15600 [Ruminococcus sp.]|uniref:hypothetical protein n=1 Tax=Ruminococcus sp. TaxID=41978 RepID=UPI0025F3423A|nr:hypothetical protein [Ruminococcus sp.]MBO4867965.1 hypothetical protein [Ruminococcus sp.]